MVSWKKVIKWAGKVKSALEDDGQRERESPVMAERVRIHISDVDTSVSSYATSQNRSRSPNAIRRDTLGPLEEQASTSQAAQKGQSGSGTDVNANISDPQVEQSLPGPNQEAGPSGIDMNKEIGGADATVANDSAKPAQDEPKTPNQGHQFMMPLRSRNKRLPVNVRK